MGITIGFYGFEYGFWFGLRFANFTRQALTSAKLSLYCQIGSKVHEVIFVFVSVFNKFLLTLYTHTYLRFIRKVKQNTKTKLSQGPQIGATVEPLCAARNGCSGIAEI